MKLNVIIRNRNFLFLFTLIVFSLNLACSNESGASSTTTGNGDNTLAATVNSKEIKMNEVARLLNQQIQGRENQLSDLELATARLQILENLINQEVLFQRAEKENLLPKDEEVATALQQLKQQAKMTEEQYQAKLKEQGQTEEVLREDVRRQLALQKLQEKAASNVGTVSEREVEAFYNANKAQFVNPRGVTLAAIVIDPQDNGAADDAKSEVEATSKINNISQQLKSGADFATVARARSEDQSSVQGGDLGFATEAQLVQQGFPKELVARLFTMNVGDITEPVRSPDGRLSIFKLTNKRLQTEPLTLESPGVKEQIIAGLTNERKSLRVQLMTLLAMNEAKINNHLARRTFENAANLSGVRPAGANPQAANSSNGNAAVTTTASPASSPQAAASPR